MKKLVILLMAMVMVVSMSLGVMALTGNIEEDNISGDINVKLYMEKYAELELPGEIDLGDIDLSDDYGKTSVEEDVVLKMNSDLVFEVASEGFGNKLDDWVTYKYPFGQSWFAPGESKTMNFRTVWAEDESDDFYYVEDGKMEGYLTVGFNHHYGTGEEVDEDNFYKLLAGDYNDTLTVTVSAQ